MVQAGCNQAPRWTQGLMEDDWADFFAAEQRPQLRIARICWAISSPSQSLPHSVGESALLSFPFLSFPLTLNCRMLSNNYRVAIGDDLQSIQSVCWRYLCDSLPRSVIGIFTFLCFLSLIVSFLSVVVFFVMLLLLQFDSQQSLQVKQGGVDDRSLDKTLRQPTKQQQQQEIS